MTLAIHFLAEFFFSFLRTPLDVDSRSEIAVFSADHAFIQASVINVVHQCTAKTAPAMSISISHRNQVLRNSRLCLLNIQLV